jgi:hypothetical protein
LEDGILIAMFPCRKNLKNFIILILALFLLISYLVQIKIISLGAVSFSTEQATGLITIGTSELKLYFDPTKGGMPVSDSFGLLVRWSIGLNRLGDDSNYPQSYKSVNPRIEYGETWIKSEGRIERTLPYPQGREELPAIYVIYAEVRDRIVHVTFRLEIQEEIANVTTITVWSWINASQIVAELSDGKVETWRLERQSWNPVLSAYDLRWVAFGSEDQFLGFVLAGCNSYAGEVLSDGPVSMYTLKFYGGTARKLEPGEVFTCEWILVYAPTWSQVRDVVHIKPLTIEVLPIIIEPNKNVNITIILNGTSILFLVNRTYLLTHTIYWGNIEVNKTDTVVRIGGGETKVVTMLYRPTVKGVYIVKAKLLDLDTSDILASQQASFVVYETEAFPYHLYLIIVAIAMCIIIGIIKRKNSPILQEID